MAFAALFVRYFGTANQLPPNRYLLFSDFDTRCRMIRYLVVSAVLLGLAVHSGCGNSGTAQTARVDGTVTLDGAPLPNAKVGFNPAPGSKTAGRLAMGTADGSGKFSLSSFNKNDGAMPGSYIVTVIGDGVPEKYTSQDKTDLKVTVEAGKTNPIKLELKKGE